MNKLTTSVGSSSSNNNVINNDKEKTITLVDNLLNVINHSDETIVEEETRTNEIFTKFTNEMTLNFETMSQKNLLLQNELIELNKKKQVSDTLNIEANKAINERIDTLKNVLIDNLTKENQQLKDRVSSLEDKFKSLENRFNQHSHGYSQWCVRGDYFSGNITATTSNPNV